MCPGASFWTFSPSTAYRSLTTTPMSKPRHVVAASQLPVVSNTTPVINLVGVGYLHLLPALYGTVTIADAVRDEYVAGKSPTDPNLDSLPWLQVVSAVPLDP